MTVKFDALSLYNAGKQDNLLYRRYKQTLRTIATEALKNGLSQFVLHIEDFKQELYEYNKRSLYKIDLAEQLEEFTFKGLQDLFEGRFVVEVRTMTDNAMAYYTTKIFVYLLDALEDDNNKEYLEKRYDVLVSKYK